MLDLTTTIDKPTGPPAALDRTRREHVARLDRVIWSNDDTGYAILALHDGNTAKGTAGDLDQLTRGDTYRFLGRWDEDERYGHFFRFETFTKHEPATGPATIRYLTKNCDDIGEGRARKLWEAYGPETCQVIREQTDRVVADGLLSLEVATTAAATLTGISTYENTKLDLFGLFDGRGFPGALIDATIEKWGAKAPNRIRKNPFALLVNELPGCGFKRCDRLWIDLGCRRNALKRQMICGWNAVKTNTDGHTWLDAEKTFIDAIRTTISGEIDPIKALRLGIRSGWLARRRDHNNRLWLAEAEKAQAEREVAQHVRRLLAGDSPCMWPSGPLPGIADKTPSDHQNECWESIRHSRCAILTGGPGTGKTFTVAAVLRRITEQFGLHSVAVCAPTGKAAVRCTQAMQAQGLSRLRAVTIHTLLRIWKAGYGGDRWAFEHDEKKPLPFRFVIVDEVSMVDTNLMASLLAACAVGTHVLLVGDPHQLPPVGHGAPLRDLLTAGIPHYELTEIRRNAGTIVRACAAIKSGKPFHTDAKFEPEAEDPKNLRMIETSDPNEAVAIIEGTLTKMRNFHPVWQTQVLVAVNAKSPLSRNELNKRLQLLLNPAGQAVAGNPFRIDDKIICLRNCWIEAVEPNCPDLIGEQITDPNSYIQSGAERYVANGEIGRVVAISPKVTIARFSEADVLVRIPMRKRKATEPINDGEGTPQAEDSGAAGHFDLAYAITGHKSQGSESPCVIVCIDKGAGLVANREWHYTCLSRASKLCILVGDRNVMLRQIRRVGLTRRKTFLVEQLKEPMTEAVT